MNFADTTRKMIIPPEIRRFLLRALFFLFAWQFSYQIFLKDDRSIDLHVTNITSKATAGFLANFYPSAIAVNDPSRSIIWIDGRRVISIADGCNALELFVLYIAFLFCMPASNFRRLIFGIVGVISIFIINVLRCCGIAWLHINHPRFVDFAHHYVFAVLVYSFIFLMLMLFSKGLTRRAVINSGQ